MSSFFRACNDTSNTDPFPWRVIENLEDGSSSLLARTPTRKAAERIARAMSNNDVQIEYEEPESESDNPVQATSDLLGKIDAAIRTCEAIISAKQTALQPDPIRITLDNKPEPKQPKEATRVILGTLGTRGTLGIRGTTTPKQEVVNVTL